MTYKITEILNSFDHCGIQNYVEACTSRHLKKTLYNLFWLTSAQSDRCRWRKPLISRLAPLEILVRISLHQASLKGWSNGRSFGVPDVLAAMTRLTSFPAQRPSALSKGQHLQFFTGNNVVSIWVNIFWIRTKTIPTNHSIN